MAALIELSSHGTITHSSPLNISTTSTYGTTGTLLIDPANILIADPSTFSTFNSFRALLSGGGSTGTNPNAVQANAEFGISVALTTTHALIGADKYSYSGVSESGNAFLYNLSNGTWTNLLAADGAPVLQTANQFGNSVALSATHALIGAHRYSYSGASESGNAFLYNLSNGTWTGTSTGGASNGLLSTNDAPVLQATDAANVGSSFGVSVALSTTHALIGANQHDYSGTSGSGTAYLYNITGPNAGTWTNLLGTTTTPPAPQTGAQFGHSVALSTTHALIGAHFYPRSGTSSTGTAFLYNLSNGTWTNLIDTNGAPLPPSGALFGVSVALSTTHALIGARQYNYTSLGSINPTATSGNAYLYEINNTAHTAWTGTFSMVNEVNRSNGLLSTTGAPLPQSPAQFGTSVALTTTHALIGAKTYNYTENNSGNAYLYTISDGTWAGSPSAGAPSNGLLSTTDAPPPQASAQFGFSVALSFTHALIGANDYHYTAGDTGNAFLYNISGGANSWVYLLDSIANIPTPQADIAPVPDTNPTDFIYSNFGNAVALTETHALIGASRYDYTPSGGTLAANSGNAFLYNLSNGTWTNLLATANAPTIEAGDNFGISVALNATYALIGANLYDSSGDNNAGNAYLYRLNGTDSFRTDSGTGCLTDGTSDSPWCTLSASSGAPTAQDGAQFGYSVALNATYALIGARLYNSTVADTGNAFLYRLNGTDSFRTGCLTDGASDSPWCTLSTSSGAPTLALGDNFGESVALSTTHALIGAELFDHSSTTNSGNAFLYRLPVNSVVGAWTNLLATTNTNPNPPAAQASAHFGTAVALSSTHALIGANFYDYPSTLSPCSPTPTTCTQGNAFLYRLPVNSGAGAWIGANNGLLSVTGAPAPQAQAQFGFSVALTATHALIGASGYDRPNASNSGNAFLYTIDGGTWTDFLATAGASTAQASARIGSAVALSATHALIGASGYDHSTNLQNSGNAYLVNLGPNGAPAFDFSVSPATILSALGSNDVSYTATNTIYVYSPINLSTYTGTNTLTLRAPTITFTLSAANSVVGSANNRVILARPSGSWTAANLTLPTNGTSHLSTAAAGILAGIASSARGTINIAPTTGNFVTSSNLTATNLTLNITATMGSINLGNSAISVADFTATAMGMGNNITGGTITAPRINLTASNGSIGTRTTRIRVRARANNFSSFLATASSTSGNVYLSTNNGRWLAYVDTGNRMVGDGMLSIILEPVAKKKEPGGAFSFALDPILSILGSGCEKDDIFATLISGFGILCGEE